MVAAEQVEVITEEIEVDFEATLGEILITTIMVDPNAITINTMMEEVDIISRDQRDAINVVG